MPVELAPVRVAARPDTGRRNVVFDVSGLTVSYGSSAALRGVDLEIYRNLITAVIGPSGCGKSTFVRCGVR